MNDSLSSTPTLSIKPIEKVDISSLSIWEFLSLALYGEDAEIAEVSENKHPPLHFALLSCM